MKPLRLLFILIFLASSTNRLMASHASGASVSLIKTANPDEYLIRLYLYDDCPLIFSNAAIIIKSASLGVDMSAPLSWVNTLFLNLNPCVPTGGYDCAQGRGTNQLIYEGIANLPPAADWNIFYEECCRNNAITNIYNTAGYSLHVAATLDNLNFPNNSTPDFIIPPLVYVCLNSPSTLFNMTYEPDGDSVVYSLVAPEDYNGTEINNYSGNLDPQTFLVSSTPVTINTVTGDVNCTPSQQQFVVCVVQATEYRNGVISGAVRRDCTLKMATTVASSIAENSNETINIYPVPASDFISFDLPEDAGMMNVEIYNMQGAKVNSLSAEGKTQISIAALQQGLYTVQFRKNNMLFTSRFVK